MWRLRKPPPRRLLYLSFPANAFANDLTPNGSRFHGALPLGTASTCPVKQSHDPADELSKVAIMFAWLWSNIWMLVRSPAMDEIVASPSFDGRQLPTWREFVIFTKASRAMSAVAMVAR